MTDTTTNATVSKAAGFEGLQTTRGTSPFRISKDSQGTPVITLSGQGISRDELMTHVVTLQASSNKLVFDISQVTRFDVVPLRSIVSLSEQCLIELMVTPRQHQQLVSMKFDKLVGPQFMMTTVEGDSPSVPVVAPSNRYAWSSPLSTPSRGRAVEKEAPEPAGPVSPPITKLGATQVLPRGEYVEIIPPADILLKEESILTLGTYLKSLEKSQTYTLNLSAAISAKGSVLAGVLFQAANNRIRHDASPIVVALPQAMRDDVIMLCKLATGVTFVQGSEAKPSS